MRILAPIFILIASTAQATGLPDTGQNLCYDGSAMVACTQASAGYPGQDGRFGRDAAATVGALPPKTGGGLAGRDYTRICVSGEAEGTGSCPNNPTSGETANDWGCTQDNITGLLWEVKSDDGAATYTNLRDKDSKYTWYMPSGLNGSNAGTVDGGTGLNSDLCHDATKCDTDKFITEISNTNLCGHADWRLPSKRELHTLTNYGQVNNAIDPGYFPNTIASYYWSSSSYANDPANAWVVDFYNGYSSDGNKSSGNYVWLVRGGPF